MKNKLYLANQRYSEEELEGNIHLFSDYDWYLISQFQNLSEDFIDKHSGKVDWIAICRTQILSELFIEKNLDKLDWYYISMYQKLSERFIRKHIRKIDINWLMGNEKISKNIKSEIKKEINLLKDII